jgi:hypothetical protein
MLKKILFITLTVLIGAVFIISGYTKGGFPFLQKFSSPIEPFEFTFVDLGIGNWKTAPFIARLLIGLEFFIGVILILNVRLKKVGYPLAIAVLGLFSVYLLLLMGFSGNSGNCGCFGSVFTMTPLWALVKNLIMIALLAVLYKFHPGWDNKNSKNVIWGSLLITMSLPFIWNAVELDYSEAYLNKPETDYKLELDSLYNNAKLNVPPRSLSTGKHVIAFMSLTCPHCKIAAKKIRIMHERNPEIPFYFVLNGDDNKLKPFFKETKTESIPHCMLLGRSFVMLAGTNMPAIYLVNNSIVEHDVDYMSLDQGELEEWLKK